MSESFPDGTVVVVESESGMAPYNVYVKSADAGWGDRVWLQAGSDLPCVEPAASYRVVYRPGEAANRGTKLSDFTG